jgi:CBS domain-containing protein
MKKVSYLIKQKGNNVLAVQASQTVYEAIEVMAARNVGSLVVYDGEKFVGVLTERDYTQKVILKGKHSHDTKVAEIMDDHPHTVTMNDGIEKCMQEMTDNHIRYLPVVEAEKVIGVVAMSDLVKHIIDEQKNTIQNLQNYISGTM